MGNTPLPDTRAVVEAYGDDPILHDAVAVTLWS